MTLSKPRLIFGWLTFIAIAPCSVYGQSWSFTPSTDPQTAGASDPSQPPPLDGNLPPSISGAAAPQTANGPQIDAPIGAQVLGAPFPAYPSTGSLPLPANYAPGPATDAQMRQSPFPLSGISNSPPSTSFEANAAQANAYWGQSRIAEPARTGPYNSIRYGKPPVSSASPSPAPSDEWQFGVAIPPAPADSDAAAAQTLPAPPGAESSSMRANGIATIGPSAPYPQAGYAPEYTYLPVAGGRMPGSQPTGFFFRWDRLWTTINSPNIGSVGDPGSVRIGTTNGIPYPFINSIDGDFINERPEFGDRLEFGFLNDSRSSFGGGGGWYASVLLLDQGKETTANGGTLLLDDPIGMLLGFQDANGDGIDDDIDADNIFGRFGEDLGTRVITPGTNAPTFVVPFDGQPDTPAPQDNGDLVTWVPIFESVTARNNIDLSGFELSGVRDLYRFSSGTTFRWLFGCRYLDIDERLFLQATGSSFVEELTIDTSVENFAIGPLIGLMLDQHSGPVLFGASVRFTPAANFQRGRQYAGMVANLTNPGAANQPLNLFSTANTTFEDDTQFSPLLEWRLETGCHLAQWCSVRAGYTGWYVGGLARAGNTVQYSIPSFGFDLDNSDYIIAHALTLGLELNF